MKRLSLLAFVFAVVSVVCAAMTLYLSQGVLIAWHIPAAILSYLAFVVCVVLNIGRASGRKWPLSHALRACDHGLFFALATLVTGMIWGVKSWGHAWIWEPRLTGMFLMTLIFVSWRLASRYIADHVKANGAATSALIVLGLPALAFTHLATRLFGGVHPSQMPKTGAESHVGALAFICATIFYLAFAWTVSLVKMCLAKRRARGEDVTK